MTYAVAEVIPDPVLRQLVRETLELPAGVPITEIEIKRLTKLIQGNSDIEDLTGLEHATELERLEIYGSHITDLSPIQDLTSLTRLGIAWNKTKLSDISPLAKLVNLQHLDLNWNEIVDITPLTDLTQLQILKLRQNKISNITALSKLTKLKHLDLLFNNITDFSPVSHLSINEFLYHEVCELTGLSIEERVQNRSFPSIFIGWRTFMGPEDPVWNRPELTQKEQLAYHDLYYGGWYFTNLLAGNGEQTRFVGDIEKYRQYRDSIFEMNPNILFITVIKYYRSTNHLDFPEDWDGWLRDASGERIRNTLTVSAGTSYFVDITSPAAIDEYVRQAVAVGQCGLYDGIMFDWWSENSNFYFNHVPNPPSAAAQTEAKVEILRRIREIVKDDILILGNVGRKKIPLTAPYMNGGWMESGKDNEDGYTYEGLRKREETLYWLENNTREPRVNGLEMDGIGTQPPDSSLNQKWMRIGTTLTLTHSDGYFSYNIGMKTYPHDHSIVRIDDPEQAQAHYELSHQTNKFHIHGGEHYLYSFWDADLGKPVGEKRQRYEDKEGLFIREFTNGWVVYNRSHAAQTVLLPEPVASVTSGIKTWQHTIPDLDGDIYLKIDGDVQNRSDINGDGVVNILDLVIIATRFNTAKPDLNGDGVVNILDLVIVAKEIQSE